MTHYEICPIEFELQANERLCAFPRNFEALTIISRSWVLVVLDVTSTLLITPRAFAVYLCLDGGGER